MADASGAADTAAERLVGGERLAGGELAAGGAGASRRGGGWARWLVGGLAVAFALIVGLAGWVAVRGLMARSQLDEARTRIVTLQRQVLAGDVPADGELRVQVAGIAERARAARSLTGDPVWSAFG
ncbi:beta-glucan endohydrolase, partial [Frankia sp. AiPs1]|nr:beta-glucan endohydrolase [Frankia sp. AiPs1]